jgi:hypothetical protein
MSTSREVSKKPSEEIIEIDGDDEDDQIGDLEEEMEMEGDPFGNYLVNEEGDNIADILSAGVKQMEMQNKILIKILTVLSKADSVSRAK